MQISTYSKHDDPLLNFDVNFQIEYNGGMEGESRIPVNVRYPMHYLLAKDGVPHILTHEFSD